jgi:hypothetical protein
VIGKEPPGISHARSEGWRPNHWLILVTLTMLPHVNEPSIRTDLRGSRFTPLFSSLPSVQILFAFFCESSSPHARKEIEEEDDWQDPLRDQRTPIDPESQTVQHRCAIAQEKTNHGSDVFALGKPAQRNPSQFGAAFGRIAPGAFAHLG